jgi:molybdopterin converting factor subunit 1
MEKPVKLTIMYFAAVREIVGRGDMTLDAPPSVNTVGALATYLEANVAGLAGRLSVVRWAKNESFVELDERLEDGDVIALIPPVAGGCR